MARIFVDGAVSITMTEQGAPSFRAANATPCAALPALTVQTPSFRTLGGSRRSALYAPRILNDPIGCNTSSFKYSSVNDVPSRSSIRTSGVRTATPRSALAASCTSARVTRLLVTAMIETSAILVVDANDGQTAQGG